MGRTASITQIYRAKENRHRVEESTVTQWLHSLRQQCQGLQVGRKEGCSQHLPETMNVLNTSVKLV